MNCPYCSGELTDGFVQSRDSLFFTTGLRAAPHLPPRGQEFVKLPRTDTAVAAHYCPVCRKILIDLEK